MTNWPLGASDLPIQREYKGSTITLVLVQGITERIEGTNDFKTVPTINIDKLNPISLLDGQIYSFNAEDFSLEDLSPGDILILKDDLDVTARVRAVASTRRLEDYIAVVQKFIDKDQVVGS
jgi:hypothetical protein